MRNKLMLFILSILSSYITLGLFIREYISYFIIPIQIFATINIIIIFYIIFNIIFLKKTTRIQVLFLEISYIISFLIMLLGREKVVPKVMWSFQESLLYTTNKEIALNILLFIPLGFINMKYRFLFIIPYFIIFILEVLQYYLKVGVFDVSDILFNYIGITIGLILGYFVYKERKKNV